MTLTIYTPTWRRLVPISIQTCSQQPNWTDLHQVDPVTRRVIGHARQRHEVDWLQCERCSSVQFSSCAVNTRTGIGYTWYLSRTHREAETSDADYFLFLLVVSANTYSLAAHRRFWLAAVWRLACARFVYDYALYKFTFIIIILSVCQQQKKVKVAHTRLSSVRFRSWSRFLAVSVQMTWVINPTVGCHYFPPGPQLPSQPLRGLLPISLLGEQRHDGYEQSA